MPHHLRPTAPIAADALLPGDPKRAMELATALVEQPVMSNLSRGLWGYHGVTADRLELTVQSTGVGGPSAAVVLTELADLGVRRAIRIGTCTALDPKLSLGDTLVVETAVARDGVGSALATGDLLTPDPELSADLARATAPSLAARVASTDLTYDHPSQPHSELRDAGAVAVDLSSAALLAVGRQLRVAVASALVVAGSAAGERLAGDALETAALALGVSAGRALAGAGQSAAPLPEAGAPLP